MYIIVCPNCGEENNLSHDGSIFNCNECGNEYDLEDMEFEFKEANE